jgi:hypothetical protein
MVRRGSTVRVRQRASAKDPAKRTSLTLPCRSKPRVRGAWGQVWGQVLGTGRRNRCLKQSSQRKQHSGETRALAGPCGTQRSLHKESAFRRSPLLRLPPPWPCRSQRGCPARRAARLPGPSPNGGWRVIEVWDSEEEAQRFFEERGMPAFEAVGSPAPPAPQVWRVHNYIT